MGKGNKTVDMPADVDYMGLKNVADEAVLAGARRLIILSSAGVARPLELKHLLKRPLASTLSGRLVWKRRGELAAIEACRSSGFKTTYTVIRAGDLGESDWKDAYRVKPAEAAFFQVAVLASQPCERVFRLWDPRHKLAGRNHARFRCRHCRLRGSSQCFSTLRVAIF
jgi:nucleoside-diphosphate-sugar epimerase